jgi:hypothetical protein
MIDLTNKTVDEINGLIQKYASVLELLKPQDQPYFAYIMDIAVNYIETNYKDLNSDWKAWSTFVLRKLYDKIKTESDIKKIIDDFVEYWRKEYEEYCNNLGMHATEYDRDRGFVYNYMEKK